MDLPWIGKFMYPLMFAYNTSFQCCIQATPFSLTYGIEAQLPSFFALDFHCLHDPQVADDNLLHMLHHAWDIAVGANLLATDKQKEYFDKTAMHHEFQEGNLCYSMSLTVLTKTRSWPQNTLDLFKLFVLRGRTMWSCCSTMVTKLLSMLYE